MNRPSSSSLSLGKKVAGMALSLMAASCSSDDIAMQGSLRADSYQNNFDGQVNGSDASITSPDAGNSPDSQQDIKSPKKTPVTASCQAVQDKLNVVFQQIDNQCPIVDAEIKGLDEELLAHALTVIQNFEDALSGDGASMKRYNSAATEGTLYLADKDGKLDTKYMIDTYDSNDSFVLNIGNIDLQIIFGKYTDTDGKEVLWLKQIQLAVEQDVCKPATNPYDIYLLELSEQGPGYGHAISKNYEWNTFSDNFPEQGTFECNTKSQVIDCPTSTVNPWLSERIAYDCNPLEVNMKKSKVIPPENGFALAQKVLDAAKPLVTGIMSKYSKDDTWKKITWLAQ